MLTENRSRKPRPGAIPVTYRGSQGLPEQQIVQDFQNLAGQEEPPAPPAPPSLPALREVYKQYYVEDSIEPKDRNVAAYIQALESERRSAIEEARDSRRRLEQKHAQFRNLFSSVISVIEKNDPLSRDLRWEQVPKYIEKLCEEVNRKAEVIEQKQREIEKLSAQTISLANEMQILKGNHDIKELELEKKREHDLQKKEVAHLEAVDHLKVAYKTEIARHQTTISTLQSEMLAAGSRFQPITDSSWKNRLGLIRTLVHSLAHSSPVIDAREYGHVIDRAEFAQTTEGKEMYLLDASIWKILLDGIFSSPFRVFGKYGEIIMSHWEQIFGAGELFLSFSTYDLS
jgi:hypothetical protein